jgi:DNA-binding transcriptional ArsR family regulator
VNAPARTLPLRVPPVPGEALDSWLEALARRSQVTVGTLTAALGWPLPASPGGLVAGIPAQVLRRIEDQTGLAAGRLDDAVLDRYLPLGPVRRRGSRYCPSCLAERDGRWLLSWRLGWVFACTTHGVLLCDTCPACLRAPRGRAGRAGLNPPGSCASTIKRHEHCGADLRQVTPSRLAPGHPVLAAQYWTAALLTHDDTGPGGNGASPRNVLSDLGIIASWVLRQAPAAQFAGFGPAALAAWRAWNQQTSAARRQPGRVPPASAALTAALAATAMTMLTGSDEQAIAQIRALLPPRAGPRQTRPAGLPAPRWRTLSAAARGRFLRALDPDLGPADRIRYRTGTPQARIPDDPPGRLAARARAIPQLLWPDWAIRLMPARGFAPGPFRSTIAACLLLPGHPGRATGTAITALHAHRSALATGTVLRALADGGHDTVLTAISCLAGYLDTSGSPIDYQRRRDLIPAETITACQWRDLCYGAAAHPGEARRHRDAQRYLFQLLTGADLHDPRHALAFTSGNDYSHYQTFAGTLPTGLRDALHGHATGLLHDLGIGEPLTWAPPPGCCTHLNLPGPEPDDIDLDAVGHLIITGRLPVTDAAARLGTTTSHVRLALEHLPRPARQWGRSAAPPTWQRQQHARVILTREFFEREYIAAGKNLRQLEAETGIPRRFLTRVAREHGITMTGVRGPAPADPCPLPGPDLTGQTSGSGSPAEPSAALPDDIRRAAGDNPAGWHRLRRFQIAMASPTIAAAAAGLRICPSALSHQLCRLEGDIGAKLYQPATSRRPWRPTRRGAALLTALARPGIQALAAAHAPDVSGPARSRSPYRDRMPISLGSDAEAARQAASLFRVLANPTRLAILLALQTAEQRITDLTARLGGSQANISAHLTRLKQSGLITSRQTKGRAVYYRLVQPELGALLQAAGQLHAPARQQATEENDTTVRKTPPTS